MLGRKTKRTSLGLRTVKGLDHGSWGMSAWGRSKQMNNKWGP